MLFHFANFAPFAPLRQKSGLFKDPKSGEKLGADFGTLFIILAPLELGACLELVFVI